MGSSSSSNTNAIPQILSFNEHNDDKVRKEKNALRNKENFYNCIHIFNQNKLSGYSYNKVRWGVENPFFIQVRGCNKLTKAYKMELKKLLEEKKYKNISLNNYPRTDGPFTEIKCEIDD